LLESRIFVHKSLRPKTGETTTMVISNGSAWQIASLGEKRVYWKIRGSSACYINVRDIYLYKLTYDNLSWPSDKHIMQEVRKDVPISIRNPMRSRQDIVAKQYCWYEKPEQLRGCWKYYLEIVSIIVATLFLLLAGSVLLSAIFDVIKL